MILSVVSPMGGGKTLFATLYALDYHRVFPNNRIYANFNLNIPNFVYTSYFFMKFSEIGDCLIICDDFYALQSVKVLLGIIVNKSRKRKIDCILTCQYYTMIPKSVRTLSNAEVEVKYDDKNDILNILFVKGSESAEYEVQNAVKNAKPLYNTLEEVDYPTESEIINQIASICESFKDIELNAYMYSNSQSVRKRIISEVVDLTGLIPDKKANKKRRNTKNRK